MSTADAARAAHSPCPSCGYLADPSGGPVNFCPKCGAGLRDGAEPRPPASPRIGAVIADRYKLLALLGEGGMGAVYKAEHVRMGKALALKVLRGDFARDPGAVRRFDDEARIVSRLSHPHTIAVFDFGDDGADGLYLAMEYVPGRDLASVLKDEGALPPARVVAIGQQILGSLAEAHDAGIVHRDVKPANVMLMQARGGDDFVKVLDFGIAKLRDDPGAASVTSVGAILGTPSYLSPEQARGRDVDGRADLYAVGALLYELAAGRPPFVAPNPLAVVNAHLHDPPPPLVDHAPGVPAALAEVIHRALAKRPEDRFASADAMREALLAAGVAPGERTPRRPFAPAVTGGHPAVTGDLEIASRDDFQEFERQLRAIKRSRVAAPAAVALLLAAAGLAAWRWPDVYALLARRAPALVASLPTSLRPSDLYDGAEHEPNDSPAQANPLPIPAGPDGRVARGTGRMRGHVGARLSDTTGDIDVFRVEIPPGAGPAVLVAEWSGEARGEGIRGLDVALTLNRQRDEGSGGAAAPLVANVDRAGPGRPETLTAAVGPGTYFLAVRERHRDDTGPVEKPTDGYLLEVHLAEPKPGQEVEGNDRPDAAAHRFERYAAWRQLAEQNRLAAGASLRGETSRDDPDLFAAVDGGPDEPAALLAAIPADALAVEVERWAPDAEDLGPERTADRVRFERAGRAAPGQVLLVPLGAPAKPAAPVLVRLRAAEGAGAYDALVLGPGRASAAAAIDRAEGLARGRRFPQALELLAGYLSLSPSSAARPAVLLAAGRIAAQAAEGLPASAAGRFARAAALLGEPIFAAGPRLRYHGAFEARVGGGGRPAEEAQLRLIALATPCTSADVARRAVDFLVAHPGSPLAQEARLWQARALEDDYWSRRTPALAARAAAAYRTAAALPGPGAAEAERRARALQARRPEPQGAVKVCR